MYTIGYNGVQICKKKYLFETVYKITTVLHRNVYSVHFLCTHYGRKMLAALFKCKKKELGNSKIFPIKFC